MSQVFRFECSDVFGLIGRGLVFRGYVLNGSLDTGGYVKFSGERISHRARVIAIELNRVSVPSTVEGKELGLLLGEFTDASVNLAIEATSDDRVAARQPSPQELLGIKLPLVLLGEG